MSGNVWEWCWDAVSSNRLLRGGGWNNSADSCTVAFRDGISPPGNRNVNFGFRLARSSGN